MRRSLLPVCLLLLALLLAACGNKGPLVRAPAASTAAPAPATSTASVGQQP